MASRTNKHSANACQTTGRSNGSIALILLAGLLLSGCYQPVATSMPQLTPADTAVTLPINTSIPLTTLQTPTQTKPFPSPTQPAYTIWLPPYLPEKMRSSLILPSGFTPATSLVRADATLAVSNQINNASSLWVYALVAPFPTITDGISSDDLKAAWVGEAVTSFNGAPLLMDEGTAQLLSIYWGAPASQAVRVLPADELVNYAWTNQPSWAIIPFEALGPRWKVLSIDGQSPIHKGFDPSTYPLSIPFILSSNVNLPADSFGLPATNRDASKLTIVAMTGVTAMVRATAYTMELQGVTYPAQDIGSLLADADITHISNEIPFWPDCPYPRPSMDSLVFCSNPSYIDLLKAVGTDIIELSGDHFMDYGTDATLYTLQMYKDLGWPYYAGGANAEEARQPVKLENNGNHIAFMGCNVGCEVKNTIPCDATATDDHPGAALCDYKYIASEIPVLKDEGYQVIFTFQHNEYYTYTIEPDLRTDFGTVAADGATIVSGSQAHQAHGFAFQDGAFIHYGLGNLFFDQFHYCYNDACDDAFIDRHVFYDGQYINTELITIRFVDFARPRLMTVDERAHFLKIIFNASGW
jgi:hypothetical protein